MAVELDVDDRAQHLGDAAGLDVLAADIVHLGSSARVAGRDAL